MQRLKRLAIWAVLATLVLGLSFVVLVPSCSRPPSASAAGTFTDPQL